MLSNLACKGGGANGIGVQSRTQLENLMKYAIACVIALFAGCAAQPVLANPTKAEQEFCLMTAHIAFNVASMRSTALKDVSLIALQADAVVWLDEARTVYEITAKQEATIMRAIAFGYNMPAGADAQEMAQYQYVGCLAVEI